MNHDELLGFTAHRELLDRASTESRATTKTGEPYVLAHISLQCRIDLHQGRILPARKALEW